jgi:hypothetical protein
MEDFTMACISGVLMVAAGVFLAGVARAAVLATSAMVREYRRVGETGGFWHWFEVLWE